MGWKYNPFTKRLDYYESGATYTDEQAQDAVGGILTDSSTVDFTYNDGVPSITAVVLPGGIDHGGLADLVADDHTQYVLVTSLEPDRATIAARWEDLTDGGSTTLHTHSFTSSREVQISTPGQTVFNLLLVTYTPTSGQLRVYINGVRQHPSSYTETDASTVTMSAGVSSGSSVLFEVDGGSGGSVPGVFVFNGNSGDGFKVTPASPDYGWHDLLGAIEVRGTGANDPTFNVFRTGIRAYQFGVNDECWIPFHIPHDYAPGTDIHLHFHWAHISTVVTGGSVTWGYTATYSKGHNQAPFSAPVTGTIVGNASTTQYQHIITEVQISDASPSASQIDTDNIEVDGLLLVRAYLSANNITVSAGGAPDPFLFYVDCHYQSTNMTTPNKAPSFYN